MLGLMNKDVTARVVFRNKKPCLVASFRNSSQPVAWHIPLTEAGRLSLSLRSDEGGWTVCLREEGATSASEVHFLGRGDAEVAYDALRASLMSRANLREWRVALYWLLGIFLLAMILTPATMGVNGAVKTAANGASVASGAVSSADPEAEKAQSKEASRAAFERSLPAVADDVLPQVQD